MKLRTIRKMQHGRAQGIGYTRPKGLYDYFCFKLSPAPEIEGLDILLGSKANLNTRRWFETIKIGIIQSYMRPMRIFRTVWCSIRSEIVSVKTHPRIPTEKALKRAGSHFIQLLGKRTHRIDFHPDWRTTNVFELADGILSDKAYDRMPILADALQEAGCEDELILSHCRLCNDHQGKCWVVDLILNQV
jgi:hypothetical protein